MIEAKWIAFILAYVFFVAVIGLLWARGIEKSIEEFPEPDDAQPSGFDSNLPR